MPTDSPRVTVNRRAESRFAAGHPWIFQSDVTDHGGAQPGDAVEVVAERGKPLGMAHYSSSSQITLRMLTHTRRPIDQEFFRERLQAALDYRSRYLQNTDACRLVHAEADGLPALIVDRYADCLTVQTLNQGMDRAKPGLLTLLQELVSPRAIVVRNDAHVRQKENLSQEKFGAAGE